MVRRSWATQLGRGLSRRCPHCGRAGIFGWWKLEDHCPQCGHRFEREPGYWVGAVIVNTIMATLAFLVSFGLLLAVTWPAVPWRSLTVVVFSVTGLVPIVFYPWARSIWMAYDLYVHPLEEKELAAARQRLRDA